MSKLIYPSNGIYPRCKGGIMECSKELSGAISNCDYNVPSGFSQRSYLNNLGDKLSQFRTEINSIGSKLQNTDKSFIRLSDDLTATANKIAIQKIKKRDRMII